MGVGNMSGTLAHAAVLSAGIALGAGISYSLSPRRQDGTGYSTAAASASAGAPSAAATSTSPYPIVPGAIGPLSDHLSRLAYAAAYDRRNRIPAWTAQHLTADSLRRPEGGGGGDRQGSTFQEDSAIPEKFRAKLLDYFRSGYDRGHMVPAADAKSSQVAMNETFLLSNIAPQVGEGFNRHYWAYLEAFCRDLTRRFDDVYVFTVPLFLPKRHADGKFRVTYEMLPASGGPPTVAVPTHFAKVILASRLPRGSAAKDAVATMKEWSMGAFVLPNTPIPDEARLESFVVPVESVESSAGLELLPTQLKKTSRPLCESVKCAVVVRRFDEAQRTISKRA